MKTLSAYCQLAIALLLGIVGLDAAPARAEAPPSLLYLGIGSAGRLHQEIDNAVQLRLSGLGLLVKRPKAVHTPPCGNAECLTRVAAIEQTDLALVGLVRKNGHACVVMLWLFIDRARPPMTRDVLCRHDGFDSELAFELAAVTGEMAEAYLRELKSTNLLHEALRSGLRRYEIIPEVEKRRPDKPDWSWKRKTLVDGLKMFLGDHPITTQLIGALNSVGSDDPETQSAVVDMVADQLGMSLVDVLSPRPQTL